MKYMFINVFYNMKKEIKYIICFFLFLIFIFIINLYFDSNYNIDTIKKILGMTWNFEKEGIIYCLYNYLFVLLLIYKMRFFDYEFGPNNFYLRISRKKYIIYKNASIFIFLILFYTIYYLIIIFINYLFIFLPVKIYIKLFFQILDNLIIIFVIDKFIFLILRKLKGVYIK